MSKCTHKTKKGQPCRARALPNVDYCIAHATKEERESRGFGGPQEGAGRPRLPSVTEVLRERVEARIDRWLDVLEEGIGATRHVGVGSGDTYEVVEVADHPTRIRAFAEAMDRAYGKPRQALEHSGPDGEPLNVTVPTDISHASDVAEILEEVQALRRANGDSDSAVTNGHHD